MESMLNLKSLSHHYGQSRTLWDVDLSLAPGECLSLIGRNGVGKTTLLNCLMGLTPASSGSVTFNGVELTTLAPERRASLGIGYVPQGRMIFPLLTVEENLRIGIGSRTGRGREIPARIFELFPVLESMLTRRGGDLSGGQQQQLAIGRALVLEPKLLILDEPTEGIQPSIVKEIGDGRVPGVVASALVPQLVQLRGIREHAIDRRGGLRDEIGVGQRGVCGDPHVNGLGVGVASPPATLKAREHLACGQGLGAHVGVEVVRRGEDVVDRAFDERQIADVLQLVGPVARRVVLEGPGSPSSHDPLLVGETD